MQRRPVVPENDVAGAPVRVRPHDVVGRRISPKLVQQRRAGLEIEPLDPCHEPSPQVETLSSRVRVRDDEGVECPGGAPRVVGDVDAGASDAAAVVRRVVLDAEVFDSLLERAGQRLVRRTHAREARVAQSSTGHFDRVEHRGFGGQVEVAHVGVPRGLAVAERADGLPAAVEDVGHDVELREALEVDSPVLLDRGEVEGAELAREGQELLRGQVMLPSEQEDAVVVPGVEDRGGERVLGFGSVFVVAFVVVALVPFFVVFLRGGEDVAEVEALDLRAEGRARWDDGEGEEWGGGGRRRGLLGGGSGCCCFEDHDGAFFCFFFLLCFFQGGSRVRLF